MKKNRRKKNMSDGAKVALIVGAVAIGMPLVIVGVVAAIGARAVSRASQSGFEPMTARSYARLPVSVRR